MPKPVSRTEMGTVTDRPMSLALAEWPPPADTVTFINEVMFDGGSECRT